MEAGKALFLSSVILTSQLSAFQAAVPRLRVVKVQPAQAVRALCDFPVDSGPTAGKGLS